MFAEINFDMDDVVKSTNDEWFDRRLVDNAINDKILARLKPSELERALKDFKTGQRWTIDTYGKPLLK